MFDIYGFNIRDIGTGFRREARFSPRGTEWMARERWPIGEDDGQEPSIELPACRRPRYLPGAQRDGVLIHVWSEPAQPGGISGVAVAGTILPDRAS